MPLAFSALSSDRVLPSPTMHATAVDFDVVHTRADEACTKRAYVVDKRGTASLGVVLGGLFNLPPKAAPSAQQDGAQENRLQNKLETAGFAEAYHHQTLGRALEVINLRLNHNNVIGVKLSGLKHKIRRTSPLIPEGSADIAYQADAPFSRPAMVERLSAEPSTHSSILDESSYEPSTPSRESNSFDYEDSSYLTASSVYSSASGSAPSTPKRRRSYENSSVSSSADVSVPQTPFPLPGLADDQECMSPPPPVSRIG